MKTCKFNFYNGKNITNFTKKKEECRNKRFKSIELENDLNALQNIK
jgi:hypothetical protein